MLSPIIRNVIVISMCTRQRSNFLNLERPKLVYFPLMIYLLYFLFQEIIFNLKGSFEHFKPSQIKPLYCLVFCIRYFKANEANSTPIQGDTALRLRKICVTSCIRFSRKTRTIMYVYRIWLLIYINIHINIYKIYYMLYIIYFICVYYIYIIAIGSRLWKSRSPMTSYLKLDS
jgi:hypothetical protein